MFNKRTVAALVAALSIVTVAPAGPPDCPDTNGDGVVDVNDLVLVIVAWGTDDPGADVTGDGVVDMDDLNAVIVGWGPCPGDCGDCDLPDPFGNPGCSDPECESIVCQVDLFCCILVWDQSCASAAASMCNCGEPARPANDLCIDAEAISGTGPFAFDNRLAMTDGDPDPLCGDPGSDQIASDVWFCWTAPCTGTATVQTCGGTDFDTKVAAYDGCGCPTGPALACNDDACGVQSLIQFTVVAGNAYLIRLGASPGAAGGPGTMTIACSGPPPNDLCIDAEAISGTGLFAFDNGLAMTDGDPDPLCGDPGSDQIDSDVWFCWTAPCTGSATVRSCGGSVFDTKVAAYDGCGCPTGPALACNDDACGAQSLIQFDVVAGNFYLIRLGASPGAAAGPGTMTISCSISACDANLCADADAIAGEGTFSFDNSAATTDGPEDPLCGIFGSQQVDNDIWCAWTATCDGTVAVQTCGGTAVDTKIAAYDGTACPPGPALACNDNVCGPQSRILFEVTENSVYLLRIGTFPGGAGGTGTFTVECDPPTPTCGDCDQPDPAGDPGCSDPDCEALVCEVEPSCCTTVWEPICAFLAAKVLCDCGSSPLADLCANADAIAGEGTFSFDNSGATTDGPEDPLCDEFGSQQVDHDIWYVWTATCDGTVTVQTCGGTAVDTKIAAYDGTACPPGPALACNDDSCGPLQSLITFEATENSVYLLRMGTSPGAPGGSGTFTISCVPPLSTCSADLCADADAIAGEGTFSFDNSAATTDGPEDPLCDEFGSQQVDNDIWCVWTATCDGTVTVQTCGGTGVDTKIAAYEGTACPPGPALACNDDTCGLESLITFEATEGSVYLLRIGTFPGAPGGTGTFTISCDPPPPNDLR